MEEIATVQHRRLGRPGFSFVQEPGLQDANNSLQKLFGPKFAIRVAEDYIPDLARLSCQDF
jgi:hypothetical protein